MKTILFLPLFGNLVSSGLRSLRNGTAALLALLALSPIVTPTAHAAIGTVDVVPAATLLLPYFEVDLANENGKQTAMRLTNTSATAILLNVVFWTDYGVPTLNFPIYQPGFTTTDVDLRLVFKGILPITASDGQDPSDRISPQGPFSQDINFASCNGILPPAGLLAANAVTALRNAHTGQGSTYFSGNCGGVPYGDNIARGYVTIDLVNSCGGPAYPSDAGYFQRATTQNVATGTVTYLDRSQNLAYGDPLVHIEASPTNPLSSGPGANTFYGRYVGFNGSDNREPLMAISQARFINGGAFTGGTDLVVWRDPGVAVAPFACNATPSGFPLPHKEIVAFDEQENPTNVVGNALRYATQRVASSTLTNKSFGFLRMNLTLNTGDPAVAGRQQSFVSVRHTASGAFGGSLPAGQVTHASDSAGLNFPINGN